MPAESRCHCAGKAAAGEWGVELLFFRHADQFLHLGQGDPAKTSQLKIIELRPAPHIFKATSFRIPFFYMLISVDVSQQKKCSYTVQHASVHKHILC